MKKKVLCMAIAVTMLLSTTVSAAPWWLSKYQVTFDNELGIAGNVTLRFASDSGSFIRPITKGYGESISLESCIPIKYGYTFKGWFTDSRTKQNQVTKFKFTKPDVLYAKWEKNPEEPINFLIFKSVFLQNTDKYYTLSFRYKFCVFYQPFFRTKTQTLHAKSVYNTTNY